MNHEHPQPAFAASVASGSWNWDIVADRLSVDRQFAELFGIDTAQALTSLPTRLFFKAIHPEDRPRMRIAMAGILAGAELFSKEFRIIAPDGAVLWMNGRGQNHFDDQNDPVRFSGFLVDITERRRAEERLRIAQTAGGVGTFEYVGGSPVVTVSDEFCRLLGLHPAAVLPARTINSVLKQGEPLLIPETREPVAPEGIDAIFEVIRSDNMAHRWIARRGEMLIEGSGYRLIGVIYDVTVSKDQEAALLELNETLESRVEQEVAIRQQAEEALRQAQKMEAIGQLTGGIAHDFNNLIMAISSSLILLRKRIPSDPQTDRLIENALQGAERGAALTQRMLAFARRQDLQTERVDIAKLVHGITDLINRTLGPAWTLALDFPEALAPVFADANQLEMALLNLTVNARDAMPQGGTIHIIAEEKTVWADEISGLVAGHYVSLCVVDSGEGMDAETLAHATEPFFTTKGIGKGTGLGLSMIDGLAKQLHGTFLLKSAPGVGTTATLLLPVSKGEAPLEPETGSPKEKIAISRILKIVAVDDDLLILMNTSAFLEDLGHHVIEANSGKQALEIILQDPDIDLLITDQAMPNMLGTQLAQHVYLERPDLPIILATGYGELPTSMQQRIIKLGKPFTQEQLAQAVADAIRSKSP